jgi:hypothetical protein
MKKGMISLTVLVLSITLALPAWGAEKPKGALEKTAPFICYMEGTVNGQKIPTGSTIPCPGDIAVSPVFLKLLVKNAGGGVAQGNISISGNVREPVGSQLMPCHVYGIPNQCPTAIAYVDKPFSVQQQINLQPHNAVDVYSTHVDLHCLWNSIGSQYFPEEIRMSAQVGVPGPGGIPVSCSYLIRINKKTP